MTNILILNSIVPYPSNYNGNSIRVLPLSCEISQHHACFLAAFGEADERYRSLLQAGVYKDILLLPERLPDGRWQRHFSLRFGHLARVAQPEYFRGIVQQLRGFIAKHRIELVIAHTIDVAEFAEALSGLPIIMDEIDCRSLSQQRKINAKEGSCSWRERLTGAVSLFRSSNQESRFTQAFRYVTTVSPVDRQVLQSLAIIGKDRVFDIPNGIPTELNEYPLQGDEMQGAIAFWGALDFPPNSSAVSWFYKEVFLPFLADQDITWYIIGRNAGAEIKGMAAGHKNIIVTGFVEDLYGLISQIPVMINPMKMGGGLKNKVLEAFALERIVISNALGMEAINARPGEHYVQAETPAEFAEAVTRYTISDDVSRRIGKQARELILDSYTWRIVGRRFEQLISAAFETPAP